MSNKEEVKKETATAVPPKPTVVTAKKDFTWLLVGFVVVFVIGMIIGHSMSDNTVAPTLTKVEAEAPIPAPVVQHVQAPAPAPAVAQAPAPAVKVTAKVTAPVVGKIVVYNRDNTNVSFVVNGIDTYTARPVERFLLNFYKAGLIHITREDGTYDEKIVGDGSTQYVDIWKK